MGLIERLTAHLYEGAKKVGEQDCTLWTYDRVADFMYLQEEMGRQVDFERKWVENNEQLTRRHGPSVQTVVPRRG